MELDKKIRQLRFKAGYTQEQLADRLGVSPQSVSKWENAVSMPDITILPQLAEVFGVTIDDLFDLSTEQKFNRIENRIDLEDELSQDVFIEYEEFLKQQLTNEEHKIRATEMLALLYWHRLNSFGKKAATYAKEAIRMAPGKKECQWILQKAAGHCAWDWNISNHTAAIAFYRQLAEENPQERLPYLYLLDHLIVDHRTTEAKEVLDKLITRKDVNPILITVYQANIALADYHEQEADEIIQQMVAEHENDSVSLFEAAQYDAKKADYAKAIGLYEKSFENTKRRPRFQDELMGIADIYEIMKDYRKAAETYDRIIDLLVNEWGFKEETALKDAQNKRNLLLAKVK